MLTLALAAVLAAGEADLSPPPLVPAGDAPIADEFDAPPPAPADQLANPAMRAPLPVPQGPQRPLASHPAKRPAAEESEADAGPSAEGLREAKADAPEGFRGSRVAMTAALAGGSGAAIVGLGLYALLNVHDTSGLGILAFGFSLPTAFLISTAIGLGVHRASGGEGSFGSSAAGGALGGGVALIAVIAYAASGPPDPGVAGYAGILIGAGALFGLGVGLMTELSNWRTLEERGLAFSVVPTRGGALASLGFGF